MGITKRIIRAGDKYTVEYVERESLTGEEAAKEIDEWWQKHAKKKVGARRVRR